MAKIDFEIPYIERHGKAFRYRRIVPADVQEQVGKRRWTKTFPARTPLAIIEQRARRLASEHDKLIARARNGEALSPEIVAKAESQAREWLRRDKAETYEVMSYLAADPTPADRVFINALEHGGRYTPDGLSLTAAHERDRRLYGGERDEKAFQYAVGSFVAIIEDKDVAKITRGDVAEWLATMQKQGLSPGTIKRRLGALRAITNRVYLDFDYSGRNPFEKHTVKGGKGNADDRLPFNREMLERIDAYLGSNKRLGHETKNIIRLMKGTGAGPAEIGGLTLSDVRLDGEIPFIWIRRNAIRGVKTTVRDRRIPLVGDALDAARDAYQRASVRSKGTNPDSTPLFKGFGINGRGADSISAKLNKAIRAAGVPNSTRLVAYSFRHTMKEALRSAGVADHVQRRLLGHAGQGVADRYGSPHARLAEARDALESAMGFLGDVDPAIYSARERPKS